MWKYLFGVRNSEEKPPILVLADAVNERSVKADAYQKEVKDDINKIGSQAESYHQEIKNNITQAGSQIERNHQAVMHDSSQRARQADSQYQNVMDNIDQIKSQIKKNQQEVKTSFNQNSVQMPLPQQARQADVWQCKKISIKGKQIADEIQRQEHIRDNSYYRPCGDIIPCFGIFDPKRTNARKRITQLQQDQSDNQAVYKQCAAHFSLAVS